MKTLEEKKLLVKMMKAFNQPVDQELVESIEREERLAKLLFKEEKKEEVPILVEQQILIKEADPEPAPAQVLTPPIVTDTVTQTMNLLNTAAPKITSTLEKAEIEGIKRTLADLMKKIGTLSWGGGGTGAVRINDQDDFDRTSYGEGKVMRWLNGMFRLDTVTGLEDFTYGAFSDTTNQTANVANTAYEVRFNTTDFSQGHYIRNNTEIVANTTGVYNYQFSMQLTSTSSSQHNAYIWIRKNNVDVANTATILTFGANKQYGVAAWNFFVDMEVGDHIHLMWAVDDTRISIAAPAATEFCPAVPSVILTVSAINTQFI